MPNQRYGRFDLWDDPPLVYLASTPEHAIAEALAAFRGTAWTPAYLEREGRPLALTAVTLSPTVTARILDLTDPANLVVAGLRPDTLAHHERRHTQAAARTLYDGIASPAPLAGFRWWSALTGAWHTTVVFCDRVAPGELEFSAPRALASGDAEVQAAVSMLGIRR